MAVQGDLVANVVANTRQFGPGLNRARSDLQSFVRGARATLLPLGGILAGAISTRESINAARTQVAAERKLEAVLQATGHAAGQSARQIKEFAASRQDITNFGDEATIAGAAVLATFKEIKGSVFTDAISLAQDMASVMGNDLQGSIVQVGKALNDPIAGMSALSKVGVSFTAQQKQQVKALQESGDLLGAQAIILAELRSEFGGAAEAMADPLTQMRNMVGDLAENIGFVLLPSIRELYAGFKSGLGPLTANVDAFKALGEWIASGVQFAVSYGKHIVAAATAMGTLVIVTHSIRAATQAWSKALLLVQALSGPKGWATAAVGLGIYAGAVVGIDYAFQDVEQSAQAAAGAVEDLRGGQAAVAAVKSEVTGLTGALQAQQSEVDALLGKYRDGATNLAVELTQIRKLVEEGLLTTEQGELFSERAVDQATGIHTRIRDMRDEIAILRGEATQADIDLARLFDKGAAPADITELQNLTRERDRLEQERADATAQEESRQRIAQAAKASQSPGFFDYLDDANKRAESLIDSLKTPADRLADDLLELSSLLALGKLNQTQHDALVAKRQREEGEAGMSPTGESDRPGPNTALEAGSTGALSQLARAMTGAGTMSVQERSVRIQERIERHQAAILELQRKQLERDQQRLDRKTTVVKMV
ncbi:MAG: phage tail length tape measure family protein [Planctomycetaceae bacterium]|nr:phage tail length tape measure family protein [Planctomycetaceae bacterium]